MLLTPAGGGDICPSGRKPPFFHTSGGVAVDDENENENGTSADADDDDEEDEEKGSPLLPP